MKRVLIVLLAVVMMFTCTAVTASASILGTVTTIVSVYGTIVGFFDMCEDIGAAISYSNISDTQRIECLGSWKHIVDELSLTEDQLRVYMAGLSAETYYWLFADTKSSIDDICDYVYRNDGTTNSLFTEVNNFAVAYNLSEDDLRAFHDIVYVNRSNVWDFCVFTQKCGLSVDDVVEWCFSTDNTTLSLDSDDNVVVSGDVLSNYAQLYNDHYGPKTAKEYISWRTDTRFAEYSESLSAPRLSFFTDGYFCGETDWQEVYLVSWYTDGTTDYFGQYQFHFYQVSTKDDSGTRIITLYCDVWDMINGGEVQTITISNQLMDYRYIDFCVSSEAGRFMFTLYPSYTKYIQRNRQTVVTPTFTMTDKIGKNIVYSSDLSVSEDINAYLACWQKAVTTHDEGDCTVAAAHDTGYYCSDKQIYMNFDFIDTTKLTEDDVITLSGDTFYDYTITNSTTGDSSTVYNYITNNYNYPVSEDTDSGEDDSGSASGDVNVSGSIDVGGAVDVNVNVNTSGSDEGGSMPVDVNLDNYLEQTPEQAKPITDFFAIFFDFLPAELLGLICLGVVVAIILRVWGR